VSGAAVLHGQNSLNERDNPPAPNGGAASWR
jgi:hypothetical protein